MPPKQKPDGTLPDTPPKLARKPAFFGAADFREKYNGMPFPPPPPADENLSEQTTFGPPV